MNMRARIFCCVLIHSLFCVGYVFLNDFVAHLYGALNGGLTSRGVNIRLTSKFLFELFIAINLVLALIPFFKVKLALWAVWVSLIPLWLLPDHPLRALFYGLAQGTFTLVAILACAGLDLWYTRKVAAGKTSGLAQELKDIAEHFPLCLPTLDEGYPWVRSLDSVGLGAYQMAFMPCSDSLARLHRLIESQGFVTEVARIERFVTLKNAQGAVLSFREQEEFDGRVVILVTSSAALVQAVRDLQITPPAPWVVFPDFNPEGLGNMQGSLQWWWDTYFQPFWESLDAPAKQAFLQPRNAPQAWLDYLQFYEELSSVQKKRPT